MGRYLFGSSLEPPYTSLCIGVTLLAFHSNGNTTARIQAENIPVREGAITIFNSLFGISSKQADFCSFLIFHGKLQCYNYYTSVETQYIIV